MTAAGIGRNDDELRDAHPVLPTTAAPISRVPAGSACPGEQDRTAPETKLSSLPLVKRQVRVLIHQAASRRAVSGETSRPRILGPLNQR